MLTTPGIIDNDMRLDLMSRLVNGDSVGTTYRNKHYKLSADLDMNNANALWGDGVNGRPWVSTDTGKNGFVPIGKVTNSTSGAPDQQRIRSFTGTLNCASNTISNLYISNTNSTSLEPNYDGNILGLFAVIETGAVITNCTLVNANITGIELSRRTGGGYVWRHRQ